MSRDQSIFRPAAPVSWFLTRPDTETGNHRGVYDFDWLHESPPVIVIRTVSPLAGSGSGAISSIAIAVKTANVGLIRPPEVIRSYISPGPGWAVRKHTASYRPDLLCYYDFGKCCRPRTLFGTKRLNRNWVRLVVVPAGCLTAGCPGSSRWTFVTRI